VKASRFQIENLEERNAPAGVTRELGGNSEQVSGSVNVSVTPGEGGASGTITLSNPSEHDVNIIVGEGPA
jgi:hypothetical protein